MKTIPFSPAAATADQLDSWYALKRNIRLEILPDEPFFSKKTLLERVQYMKTIQESQRWCTWSNDCSTMIGLAGIYRNMGGSESEPVWFYIEVNRNWRRRGIGGALLKTVAAAALEKGWGSLQTRTVDRSPAGEQFIAKTGAERIQNSYTNNLELNSINRDLIARWLKFPSGNPGIEIREWKGFFPEERIQEISDFYQIVYEAGREQHGHSGFHYSPERVRVGEKVALTGNRRRHVIHAAEEGTDRLLGLTEVSWSDSESAVVSQGYTAVLPAARGRGIARRLKAEAILKLPSWNPGARFIRTGNAGNNHTILKINTELGFSPLLTSTVWKMNTADLVQNS